MRPGIYRHFRGNLYLVLGTAYHTETNEELIVYQPLYGDRQLWVRPIGMFLELVGEHTQRFTYIG